jgi:glycosyltransferase involved in cell wall biosynthesis
MKPTITLNMIIKNESASIAKCLNSVKNIIDYYVICDNGSTDNTEEIVKECLKDIPGIYHHCEWYDFATNRNEALELAQNKADYILIIDADDHLEITDPNVFNNLKEQAYLISLTNVNITYSRIQLLKNNVKAKYVGILHEYLDLPPNTTCHLLNGCRMICGHSSPRATDPLKFQKDAAVFERELLKDPNNSRYVFYAAQSYRDAQQYEPSLKLYLQRSNMGGWNQEVYISLFEAAKIIERMNLVNITGSVHPKCIINTENAYLKAFNYLPERIEALVYLCYYCRSKDMFDKSYLYAKVASNIPQPVDALFLETACWQWRVHDELAVAAYWIGKKHEAYILNKKLLNENFLPDFEKPRILKNLEFCT